MAESRYDAVVIGSGPAGYVFALRAAQLGLRVACVEKDARLGGTCLNVGCIPSKALLESSERYEEARSKLDHHGIHVGEVGLDLGVMQKRKDDVVKRLTSGVATLFKRQKIEHVRGHGRVRDGETVVVDGPDGERTLRTDAVVLATGSDVAQLPGVEMDGERIVGSTEALAFDRVPDHLVVIGGGYIGLELGSVWRRLGSGVTVLEYLDHLLGAMDGELGAAAGKHFERQGMTLQLGAKVKEARVEGDGVVVGWEDAEGGSHETHADRVLVAVGRRPYTDGLGLDEAGVERDERGFVRVDEDWRTSVDGIFAIGDVVPGAMLAHKGEDEGIALAELLAGSEGHVDYDAIPAIVYTHPEIASVGRTEETLAEQGIPYRKGAFPYMANGRALGLGEREGWAKILAHAETDRILGAHIIGARAGDMIAELGVAMEFQASAEDVARSVHAHPTLSEIVREAALDVAGRALHK